MIKLLHGDCRAILPMLEADSFDCVITSPPYWGLRSYLPEGHEDKPREIGNEPALSDYLDTMVSVCREIRRVLKPEGVFWLNIGDCYATGAGKVGNCPGGAAQGERWAGYRGAHNKGNSGKAAYRMPEGGMGPTTQPNRLPQAGLKPKDLCMAPHRLAIRLQDDGWWVRGDQIWAKSNGMPESARDRPTRAHEYVFLLTKSETYYFGYDDVKLPPVPESISRLARAMRANLDGGDQGFVISGGGYSPPGQTPHKGGRVSDKQRGHSRRHAGFNDRWDAMEKAKQQSSGSALRSVWWIAPGGYDDAHFAVMPEELAAVCILAGCPKGGHVLDPFGGAGITALVADRLGRNATLIELNPTYRDMAMNRVRDDAPLLTEAQ